MADGDTGLFTKEPPGLFGHHLRIFQQRSDSLSVRPNPRLARSLTGAGPIPLHPQFGDQFQLLRKGTYPVEPYGLGQSDILGNREMGAFTLAIF
jgi:hypothetical protein